MLERIEPSSDFPAYKIKNPFTATVVKNECLTKDEEHNDTRHIVLDLGDSGFRYVDGQSIGVIPAGTDANGKAFKQRIYSIASGSYGDDGKNQTLTLCIKRANTVDAETNTIYKGVCSNYLCDAQVGDKVHCTGPLGRVLLMPKDESTRLILLATGTGIAPFRGFLRTIFDQHKSWSGGIDLYFGCRYKKNALYFNELNDEILQMKNANIDFNIHYAFSNEEKSKDGGRKYVQHALETNLDSVWKTLESGNFSTYICGLKGVDGGIDEILSAYASQKGKDWAEMKETFKKEKRWNVEVY